MRNNADDIMYDVTPEVLEAHASEVEVTIRGTFPSRYFHRNAILEITPVITWEDGETAMSSITLQGENVTDNYQVIPRDGGSFTHTDAVPFTPDMRLSDLDVRLTAELRDDSAVFDPRKIADGVIATSTMVINDPEPIKHDHKFQRIIPETAEAAIFYVINRANVRQSELRSERMEAFRVFLAEAVDDERIDMNSAGVTAYASPDGPIDFNERLAEQRRETSSRVLTSELRNVDVDMGELSYIERALGEDWEGFRELVEASDIRDRNLIIRVLEMYDDPEVREQEIRNLAAVFEVLADEILPQLRRSILAVDYDQIGYTDQELVQIFNRTPGRLNLEELLYTATLLDDFSAKYRAYQTAAQNYPDCHRAFNNMGAVLIELDNIAAAKDALLKAQEILNDDAVKNNLGAVALREGNLEEAEEYLTLVATPTSETNYNLGILAIKKGEYSDAAGYLENMNVFNAALVRVLQDDEDAALRILNNIQQPDARAYYLRAVIGARQQDQSMAFDNLRTAVNMDENMKECAKTDMEFARYFQDNTFISIVD